VLGISKPTCGGSVTSIAEVLERYRMQLAQRRPAPQPILDMGCPWSGGALVLRQGPHGDFLGCMDYPECEYTERIMRAW